MKFLKQAIYIRYVIAKLRPDQLAQLLRFLFTEDSLEIKKGFAFVIEFFIKNLPLHYCINWPNFITRLCLLPKLIIKMCLLCVSRHNIRISEKLKFDCLKKRALEVKKKTFFLVSQVLSFRLSKKTSKNVPDTTFISLVNSRRGEILPYMHVRSLK